MVTVFHAFLRDIGPRGKTLCLIVSIGGTRRKHRGARHGRTRHTARTLHTCTSDIRACPSNHFRPPCIHHAVPFLHPHAPTLHETSKAHHPQNTQYTKRVSSAWPRHSPRSENRNNQQAVQPSPIRHLAPDHPPPSRVRKIVVVIMAHKRRDARSNGFPQKRRVLRRVIRGDRCPPIPPNLPRTGGVRIRVQHPRDILR